MLPDQSNGKPAKASARPTSSPTTMPITAVNATCNDPDCRAFFMGPTARARAKQHADLFGHPVHVETITTMQVQPK